MRHIKPADYDHPGQMSQLGRTSCPDDSFEQSKEQLCGMAFLLQEESFSGLEHKLVYFTFT